LLQAILEDPEDDTPRLIYADWLEENGDEARAEFIRLQCALARMPEADPRRPDLHEREAELLDTHAIAWRRALPAWTRQLRCDFRRGFVAEVTASGTAFLEGGETLLQATPLEGGCLQFESGQLPTLLDSPLLLRLRRLTLGTHRWQEVEIRALVSCANLANLRALALPFAGLDADHVRTLARNPYLANLVELHLGTWESEPGMRVPGMRALAASPHLLNPA
jgi:uncharacterized protein (TIGR02996 family)